MGRMIPIIDTGLSGADLDKMSSGRQFIVSKFTERSRADFLTYLENEGFKYMQGFSRESLLESSFPVIVETSVKVVWGITSSAMASASVRSHISDAEFVKQYSPVKPL